MSGLVIRPVAAGDNPTITRIYADAVVNGTASFELDPPDEAEMMRRQRALADGGYPFLVCERAGDVVGYAYAGAYRPRPAYRFSVENSIYVARHAHRQGIGRVLLERLIGDAEACGFRQMVAVIGDSAQAPSIELHHALGFRLVGTLQAVGFKHGRWLDTVLMQRPLGLGATVTP